MGFCGNVDNNAEIKHPLKRFIKVWAYRRLVSNVRLDRILRSLGVYLTRHEGRRIRRRAIHLLAQSRRLQTNFFIRNHYHGGLFKNGIMQPDWQIKKSSQKEFCENVFASHYVLACRGGGNFSRRLYETLALGLIPVFINTDCVLPCEEWVDWKQYCVWAEECEMTRLPQKIMEFHRAMSPTEFLEKQYACRKFWEDWFSPRGYFEQFHRYLKLLL